LDYRSSIAVSDWTFSGDDVLFYWPLAHNAGVTRRRCSAGGCLPWRTNTRVKPGGWQRAPSLLFGLAYYSSDNPYPWPQALLGYISDT